jgi:hypothetical protein
MVPVKNGIDAECLRRARRPPDRTVAGPLRRKLDRDAHRVPFGHIKVLSLGTRKLATRQAKRDRSISRYRTAIDETVDASTRTVSYLIRRAGQPLVQEHGDQAPPMPATFWSIWMTLVDEHDGDVSYGLVGDYVTTQRRRAEWAEDG